jgi:hypothetical protein
MINVVGKIRTILIRPACSSCSILSVSSMGIEQQKRDFDVNHVQWTHISNSCAMGGNVDKVLNES